MVPRVAGGGDLPLHPPVAEAARDHQAVQTLKQRGVRPGSSASVLIQRTSSPTPWGRAAWRSDSVTLM